MQRNLPLGRTLSATFDQPIEERSLVLRRLLPDGTLADVQRPHPQMSQANWEVHCAAPSEPGTYLLQAHLTRGWVGTWFVVEPPPQPVDLSPLAPSRWKALESELQFTTLPPVRQQIAEAQESSRSGHPLWLGLLSVVLVLGVAELALAHWWSG
jgi:hypothetical protein